MSHIPNINLNEIAKRGEFWVREWQIEENQWAGLVDWKLACRSLEFSIFFLGEITPQSKYNVLELTKGKSTQLSIIHWPFFLCHWRIFRKKKTIPLSLHYNCYIPNHVIAGSVMETDTNISNFAPWPKHNFLLPLKSFVLIGWRFFFQWVDIFLKC